MKRRADQRLFHISLAMRGLTRASMLTLQQLKTLQRAGARLTAAWVAGSSQVKPGNNVEGVSTKRRCR
jgi:hypothetical protein